MKFIWTLLFAALMLVGVALPAQAGYYEVGASGTYRKSNFDSQSFDESFALSGSFSYLFNEMSALELSYTDGFSKRFIAGASPAPDQTTTVHTQLVDLDFVLTLGEKEATLRPYVKLGMGYLLKKRLIETTSGYHAITVDDEPKGFIPSGGAGFRLALTQNLSLKIGLDVWSSNPLGHGDAGTFDLAARAGFSWLF